MKSKFTPAKRLAVAAGVTAASLLPAVPAHATDMTIQTVCGDSMDVDITGGVAHWEAICSGSTITVSGYLQDTKEDGLCAQVKGYINGVWHYSAKACPAGEVETFNFYGPGRTANVYLYVT